MPRAKIWDQAENILSRWKLLLGLLAIVGGPPAIRLGYEKITDRRAILTQVVEDYPKVMDLAQRNQVRMQVLTALMKANMPDFDSAEFKVLYDGKYLDVDVKKALSGDIIVFTMDSNRYREVFWLFPHYDEGNHLFVDENKDFQWVDKIKEK